MNEWFYLWKINVRTKKDKIQRMNARIIHIKMGMRKTNRPEKNKMKKLLYVGVFSMIRSKEWEWM